jgi:hypothetical protein
MALEFTGMIPNEEVEKSTVFPRIVSMETTYSFLKMENVDIFI